MSRRAFPIRLGCGRTPMLFIDTSEGAEFEYVHVGKGRNEGGEHEIVVHLRLKCTHPDHEENPDDARPVHPPRRARAAA